MPEINKHLEKAERLLQKGKLKPGLEELLLARKEEPGNDEIILTTAEVYQHLNRAKEYRQCFGYLFDKHSEKVNSQKAFEYLETLQKLGPLEPHRLIACAQLLQKAKPQEAIDYYHQALEAIGAQDLGMTLECLQALASLQPSSLDLQQQIAVLAPKAGKMALAVAAWTRMGELLVSWKKYPGAVEAFEEAYRVSGEIAKGKHAAADPALQLALARACSLAGRFPRVLEILGKEGEESADPQVLALIAEAYSAGKHLANSEAVYWKLVKSSPEAINPLMDIAMEYLAQKNISSGLLLVKKLEQHLSAAKDQKGLVSLAEKLGRAEHDNVTVLEFLSKLADRLHLDNPLSAALNALFDLYFAAGEFRKATDALEHLIDVDPYEPKAFTKLQQLEGKADAATWKELAARLGKTSTVERALLGSEVGSAAEELPGDAAGQAGSTTVLGDLILQAEIFLQYKLEDKARERLQRIAKLFPGEEEKNEQLRGLFERARFIPQSGISPPPSVSPAKPGDIQADFGRISEIIRSLSRQGTVKGVLSTAVNDIGRLWQASRCVVGLGIPKRPPSMVLEYISPGSTPSDPVVLGKLVMGLQQITEEQGSSLSVEKVSECRQLEPFKAPLAALQVQSLIAIPLREADQPAGILILEQCGTERQWKANDLAVLETLGEQTVFALSNARLRSLMKTLAVTDERSGLLHRESYLNCLLSEVERMQTQKKPLSAAVLQFSSSIQSSHEGHDEVLDEFMRQFGSTFTSHLRQGDIPLKYGPHALAAIMPATAAKEAALMVEKMRKLLASFSSANAEPPPPMAAGVAEAVRENSMDSVDIVTELINRLEGALEEAMAAGSNGTRVLMPPTIPH